MSRLTNTLGRVRVAAPCEEDWNEMRGDERVRFCSRCSLNVYNLSAMTRREAERLVLGAEGRLCVRFYRREDGTMLTQNCPTGLIKLKRRVSRVASATAAAIISLVTGIVLAPESEQVETVAAVSHTKVVPVDTGMATAVGEEEEAAWVAGGASVDPIGLALPLGFLGTITSLLCWPLLRIGEREAARRRAELCIWRSDWSQPDESAALPGEGSAVELNQ